MKKKINLAPVPLFMLLTIIFLVIGGWVANIIKLVGILNGGITTMFIARIVGIFAAPIGALLGYI